MSGLLFPIHARKIKTAEEVESAIANMAQRLQRRFAKANPIFLCVMNGGLYFTGQLIKDMNFSLQLDYLHATRYADNRPGALKWKAKPNIDLKDRCVILLDDIFDEGHTLQAVHAFCLQAGAKEVYSCVLVKKYKSREVAYEPDFYALNAADDYLFGLGMDYKGYWRNLPALYAIIDSE